MALDPVTDQFSQFLRWAFLRSPNFLAGVSGWTINQDGSAEFNNLTIRGTFLGTSFEITSDGIFFYNGAPGAGNPPVMFAIRPGVTQDPFGNNLTTHANNLAVLGAGTVAGGQIITSSQGVMSFDNGAAVAALARIAPFSNASLSLESGQTIGGDPIGFATLWARTDSPRNVAQLVLTSGAAFANPGSNGLLEVQGLVGLGAVGAPGTPPAGFGYLYLSSVDGLLHFKSDAGTDQTIAGDPWHTLGALGAHYTVTLGRYRFAANNTLDLDINVVGDGLQATSVSFANTLPAAYRPATQHDSLPMGTTRQVTAGDIWPRLTVTTAGAVTVINQGTANTFAFAGRIPLD